MPLPQAELVVLQVPSSKVFLLNKESQTKICQHFKIICDIKEGATGCLKFVENNKKCKRNMQFLFLRRFQDNSFHVPAPCSHDPVVSLSLTVINITFRIRVVQWFPTWPLLRVTWEIPRDADAWVPRPKILM